MVLLLRFILIVRRILLRLSKVILLVLVLLRIHNYVVTCCVGLISIIHLPLLVLIHFRFYWKLSNLNTVAV